MTSSKVVVVVDTKSFRRLEDKGGHLKLRFWRGGRVTISGLNEANKGLLVGG